MSEQPPQDPKNPQDSANPKDPKKKSKGIPTWLVFVGTFAIVSLLGNVIFGGNTWINSSTTFISNTLASFQTERDTSQDDFCLTGKVTEIDRENTLAVVTEADALVTSTTGAIGFASLTEDLDDLTASINVVQESGVRYVELGERLLTASECEDSTFEYLMQDFGTSMVEMGENFTQWTPETLSTDPLLLLTVAPNIESAAKKAGAILTYLKEFE